MQDFRHLSPSLRIHTVILLPGTTEYCRRQTPVENCPPHGYTGHVELNILPARQCRECLASKSVINRKYKLCRKKICLLDSDQVKHKLGCTTTEDGKRLEERLYYPCCENKGIDQLCGNGAADQCICFRIYKKQVFS